MRKFRNIFIYFIVISFMLSVALSNAIAYTTIGARHSGTIAPYKWGSFTDQPNKWRTAFQNANYSWNYSTSDVQWGYNANNTYSIEQVYYLENSTEYGRFQGHATSGYWDTYAWAELNQFSLETIFPEKSATFKKSTACHEEGHSLGLGHSTATAVMNTSRDREQIYEPQSDDINGVNSIY
ncbi:MAG: matrixin family metalloprotease [Clostridia bacterium]|nr:matrixin family metalloprotease [Clostridia bacterium]